MVYVSRRNLLVSAGALALAGSLGTTVNRAAAQSVTVELGEAPEAVLSVLDPNLSAELLSSQTYGDSTYYVFAQFDDNTGEPVVVRMAGGDSEAVLIEDVLSLPPELLLRGGNAAQGEDLIDLDLSLYATSDADLVALPRGDQAASEDIDHLVFEAAVESLGDSSANAEGTNRGRLACAWFVNRVVKMGLKRSIGGGLATAEMIKVLRARHAKIPVARVVPGAIVISPTVSTPSGRNIGHVGIVGENGDIYSNSSSRATWEKNFTIDSWTNYYRGRKGLSVEFYRLDAIYFPDAFA